MVKVELTISLLAEYMIIVVNRRKGWNIKLQDCFNRYQYMVCLLRYEAGQGTLYFVVKSVDTRRVTSHINCYSGHTSAVQMLSLKRVII